MLDFLTITTAKKKDATVIYPKFIIKKSSDLMIRGSDFYAIWVEDIGLWSTDEEDVIRLVDKFVGEFASKYKANSDDNIKVLYMWDATSGMIDSWHKYCQKQMRDNFHMLDEKLIFSNTPTNKKDYASKRLSYPLEAGDISSYEKLISTLYTPEERHKIEWAIGSIVEGDSKTIQKFLVLYGAAGTGKSTILNIIQQLFEGYYSVFDAKALGSANNSFALEAFKTNPLVAIQHDGDLSRIEDNTRLNSLVSHELMTVNEKFKSTYANRFKCFLFMGTNKPVKITDGKSGLLRRLIDVTPSGHKLSSRDYKQAVKHVGFELGAIAKHCQEVYLEDPSAYDDYIPISMMGASNDFYNFVIDSYSVFKRENGTTLKAAWSMYKEYCEEAKVPFAASKMKFKEELKNYFWDFKERYTTEDGTRINGWYSNFRTDIFEDEEQPKVVEAKPNVKLIDFETQESIFDKECSDYPAQYATTNGTPKNEWDSVKTTLADIDTSKLHYVQVPENHIVIDFDIPDENGEKSFDLNLAAASTWPATYAELSKSGAGIHLHYIYNGDATKLSRVYDDHIEVKVFTGKSSLRRKLTKCNDLPIATISSGLPLKGDSKVINFDGVKNEKALRTLIKRNLNKEYHSSTRCSVDFIAKNLDDAYSSGMPYDVSDLKNDVLAFAAQSTNQSNYCIKLVNKLHFKSEEPSPPIVASDDEPLVFYDVEVFPNLFLVNWKFAGEGKPVVRMINPKPSEIEDILKFRLVGFNCRRYDNHILYARLMGYTEEQLYNLSQKIINEKKGTIGTLFSEAYNISYTDVYDFAAKKQSLKKWEIELGIHHKELGLPWDKPVPKEKWIEVAEYCDNDVLATEAVFNHLKADFTARKILADVAGLTPNDTTNTLTTRIIFGSNRKPQGQFNYRDMGKQDENSKTMYIPGGIDCDWDYTMFNDDGRPIFPGYKYDHGKSIYRDEEVGEGGYVYSEPGMYGNIALLDIASMHPSSIVAEELFGPEYTARFNEILQARIAIKHKEFDRAKKMLGGALAKYLDDEGMAADLAQALKIAINSVYGLTSANFDNPFHDPRNIDNIVAKRGALFMVNLKHEVQAKGFTVAHIKTDSIKIPDATPEIIDFVMQYGKMYGYNFEHEATYDRMCLVNNAVYIAKYKDAEECKQLYGYIPDKNNKKAGKWDATGTQFQVPYVYKTLFSREPIEFEDMCETKSVSSALYLDMNENLPEDEHSYQFIGKVGLFCPIKPGCGGGILVREAKDKYGNIKYDSANGADGYRWLEAEIVRVLDKEKDIDRSYYDKLVNDAIYGRDNGSKHIPGISDFGDFEWFISDDPYIPEDKPPWGDDDPWHDGTPFAIR